MQCVDSAGPSTSSGLPGVPCTLMQLLCRPGVRDLRFDFGAGRFVGASLAPELGLERVKFLLGDGADLFQIEVLSQLVGS